MDNSSLLLLLVIVCFIYFVLVYIIPGKATKEEKKRGYWFRWRGGVRGLPWWPISWQGSVTNIVFFVALFIPTLFLLTWLNPSSLTESIPIIFYIFFVIVSFVLICVKKSNRY